MPSSETNHVTVSTICVSDTALVVTWVLMRSSMLLLLRSAMYSWLTGSDRFAFSGRQPPVALSEIDQRPPCTASTSVTPSPLKSPKRSWLMGNDELLAAFQAGPVSGV